MGVCVSPTATLKKVDEFAADHDLKVKEWKSSLEASMGQSAGMYIKHFICIWFLPLLNFI